MGAYRHLALFRLTAAVALVVMLGLGGALSAGIITINNTDGAGEGFNDPTPAVPVGGNPGLTVGQQRLNVFQHAAGIWGAILDDDVTVIIDAGFNPLTCTATSAVLGSAGSNFIESDFPGAEFASTWYAVTLANKLAGAVIIELPARPQGAGDRSDKSMAILLDRGNPAQSIN